MIRDIRKEIGFYYKIVIGYRLKYESGIRGFLIYR